MSNCFHSIQFNQSLSQSRIQAKSCAHVKYEAGSFSPIPSLCARVQALRLRRGVGQIFLVPVPAWLDVVQNCLASH